MNRDFYFGFIACLGMFFLIGMNAISNRYKEEGDISSEFNNVYRNMQPKQFKVLTTTLTVSDFEQGELIITKNEGLVRLFTRIQNSTYSVTLSK